jgi:hypothetical protein
LTSHTQVRNNADKGNDLNEKIYIHRNSCPVWFINGCGESPKSKQRKAKQKAETVAKEEEEKKVEAELGKVQKALLQGLLKKHNPLTPDQWNPKSKQKENSDIFRRYFSLDYHLVNDEGRPALLKASLIDAYKTDGEYYLRFSKGDSSSILGRFSWQSYIDFKLKCSKEIAAEVMKSTKDSSEFVIVAKFKEFRKLDYIFYADSEKGEERAEIKHNASKSFIAKGDCIEIKPWPTIYDEKVKKARAKALRKKQG